MGWGDMSAKLCEVGSKFKIFCTLVTMATTTNFNLFNPQQMPHTTVDIPTKFYEERSKESKILLNPPFFFCRNIHCSMWQLLGVEQIQIGGRCHGNQGAKNVKFTP
jgi:hypothetical protein